MGFQESVSFPDSVDQLLQTREEGVLISVESIAPKVSLIYENNKC